ncbi:aminotransferase class V-fold PLP-dependent enzyme [Pseudohongiella spirulinae]|uniref:Cysteine desulfurase n=1 Tax=Pseudohongiella spirulinae TaxID=1249552 RepID=A0A0S2KCW1_9GAMM|nr:cysteine desulfurase [Pseudohongiella spirulinae]ALO45924.1 Cysteine desulfurase [Pseudohongiella spirulinae]
MTEAQRQARQAAFDAEAVRQDFPILQQQVNGQPLVYLDNAATTQKPRAVIDAISDYYLHDNSNVHRGAHTLSDRATAKFEQARQAVADFIGAASSRQIIWTRGTTEGINLVAASWGAANLQPGDRILVSAMEHHSNIVPWQMVAERTGARVEAIPVDESGTLRLDQFEQMLDAHVKMVSVNHVSNALGTINPIEQMIALAHQHGALVLIDGAQSIAHWPIDVKALDCDFFVFSGHKLFGPTGIGVLYGKEDLLNAMPPYQGGGEMIDSVSFDGTTYNQLPYKFEAGTPDIAGAIGLAAAVAYINGMDRAAAAAHEDALLAYALEKAQNVPGLRLIGAADRKVAVLSFVLEGVHPADLGMLLDQQGVAVRTGHHCAQPIMDQYGIPGTVRASFSFYNTFDDADRLFAALDKARQLLM